MAVVIESDHSRKSLKALQCGTKKTVDRRLRARGQFLGSVGVLACGEVGTVPIHARASEIDGPPDVLAGGRVVGVEIVPYSWSFRGRTARVSDKLNLDFEAHTSIVEAQHEPELVLALDIAIIAPRAATQSSDHSQTRPTTHPH